MPSEKQTPYRWLIKSLLSQTHLKDAQLNLTKEGFWRIVLLATIDEAYHSKLIEIRKQVSETVLNRTLSGYMGNRDNAIAVLSLVIKELGRRKNKEQKITRVIKVANILVKQGDYPPIELTHLCLAHLSQAIKSNYIVQDKQVIFEQLFNLLKTMRKQASNQVINDALKLILNDYSKYLPTKIKERQKRILAIILNNQDGRLAITKYNRERLAFWQINLDEYK